nr:molybdopterin-binding protein [Acanthopleuribacter pedis]
MIIIGNEILSAQIEDTNLKYMLRRLAEEGYAVDEARIIGDDIGVISATIRALSAQSRFVISTGGVGPTHDDVTLEAYGAAFDSPMILHPTLADGIKGYYGDKLTPAALRQATVPECTELVRFGETKWPIIKVKNCFVLPGLPEVFVRKFEGVVGLLPNSVQRYYAELLSGVEEAQFAEALTRYQEEFLEVEIGSYPRWNHHEYAAKITLKSTNETQLKELYAALLAFFKEQAHLVGSQEPAPYVPQQE